jgi:tetratricopeptide (TPR) repeat protein
MGDAVNLAARLMAKAEHGQIVATPDVVQGSRTLFSTTELEPFLVKGKKEPVHASVVGDPQGSRASIAESGLPLIGRDAELTALLDAWVSSCTGCGRLVEISADPGMGKTRLLQELLSRVDDEAAVMRGACRLYQAATPYFPFRAILRQALGLEGLNETETVAALEALVDERAPELAPWLSLIATPLDVDIPPSKEVEQLDDRFRRTRLEETVDALLAAVLDQQAILLVEDTHWADDASRDLLSRLAGSASDRPWLLVLTRRPAGESLVESGGDSAVGIELRPLEVEQAAALIDAATEDRPLMPQQERDLAERAEGNPLFLIELLDALARGEDVEALPRSVEGLIQARIDRLAPSDRNRLRELSVLGVGFLAEHASAVLDETRPRHVSRAIRRLGDFLAVDRKSWVQFRHALIRDAAYEGLPFRTRQRLHAKVGDSIVAAAGDSPEDQAELLCVHYFNAGRWQEAWRYGRIAGDRARELYANVEAARFYERAINSGTHLDQIDGTAIAGVWRELGLVREKIGQFDAALDAFGSAIAVLGNRVACADIHIERARVRYRAGRPRSALRDTAAGLRLIEGDESAEAVRARAGLFARRAFVRFSQGHTREAIALAERAADDAKRVDAREWLAIAYQVLDGAYSQLGEPDKAVYDVKVLEIYRDLGMLVSAGIAEMNLGVKAYARGDWDEASVRYARAREELERLGDHASAGFAGANLGELLVSRGLLDQADEVLASARRALRSSGVLIGAIFADLQASRIQVARGESGQAIETCNAAIAEAQSSGLGDLVVEASIHLASAHLAFGDAPRALEILDGYIGAVADDDLAYLRAPLGRERARALNDLQRHEEAADALTEALEEARSQQLLYEEALILAERSDVARRTNGSENAEELREARRLRQLLGIPEPSVA